MRLNYLFTLAFSLIATVATCPTYAQNTVAPAKTLGEIDLLDPAAQSLIDPESKIELLATGFNWSEGPVWVAAGNFVVFSDVPRNTIYKWQEGAGLSVYLKPSGFTGAVPRAGESGSNGLAIDSTGHLLLCQHGDRRVARMEASVTAPEPKFSTLAGDDQGKAFNSPNDLVIHSSGAIYFTDPPYGRIGAFDATDRELDYQGVYRVMPGEKAQLLTKELRAPNGIALSPDERTLYVAQSDSKNAIYMAYNVQDDGSIDEGRVLLNVTELYKKTPGSPDGMKVDQHGNLWATGPGGVLIISPDGKHLATIRTGERIANCAFGDDGSTLYLTSDMHFCRVKTKTKGLGFE